SAPRVGGQLTSSRPRQYARMAELVDALDSGSSGLAVRVQVPLLAPKRQAERLPLIFAARPGAGRHTSRTHRRRCTGAIGEMMRSEIVEKKPVEATVKVTVPAAEVDNEFESVLSGLARTVRIPGFRPGKAPRGVLEKRIGKEALSDEVKDKIIDAHYQAAMKEHGLLPISVHFHAQAPERGSDYGFEIHAELYPEVELPDLSSLT